MCVCVCVCLPALKTTEGWVQLAGYRPAAAAAAGKHQSLSCLRSADGAAWRWVSTVEAYSPAFSEGPGENDLVMLEGHER